MRAGERETERDRERQRERKERVREDEKTGDASHSVCNTVSQTNPPPRPVRLYPPSQHYYLPRSDPTMAYTGSDTPAPAHRYNTAMDVIGDGGEAGDYVAYSDESDDGHSTISGGGGGGGGGGGAYRCCTSRVCGIVRKVLLYIGLYSYMVVAIILILLHHWRDAAIVITVVVASACFVLRLGTYGRELERERERERETAKRRQREENGRQVGKISGGSQ